MKKAALIFLAVMLLSSCSKKTEDNPIITTAVKVNTSISETNADTTITAVTADNNVTSSCSSSSENTSESVAASVTENSSDTNKTTSVIDSDVIDENKPTTTSEITTKESETLSETAETVLSDITDAETSESIVTTVPAEDLGFTENNDLIQTTRIRITPVETFVTYSSVCSKNNNKEKQSELYLSENSEYELEIPIAVAKLLNTGDRIIVNAAVEHKANNDEKPFYLIVNESNYSLTPIDQNSDKKIEGSEIENVIWARLDLLNRFLIIKDDSLQLDEMFNALELSWKYIEKFDGLIYEPWVVYINPINYEIYYGLFGGYNNYDNETRLYEYRDGMGENELCLLMKKVINNMQELVATAEKEGIETQWFGWVHNAVDPSGIWLKAVVVDAS